MKNFGLSRLVLVSPRRFDRQRAGTLAVHAQDVLDEARFAPTLEDAVAPHVLVVPTTHRQLEGRRPPLMPREAARLLVDAARGGPVALLFGEEASGLDNRLLGRFSEYSSIPADPERSSLNLAQAVLLYSWELRQASGLLDASSPPVRETPAGQGGNDPAPQQLLTLLRERARGLLLAVGFLNPQAPDHVLDELLRLLQRSHPTRREAEMLLALLAQLERTSAVRPVR